jgi:hypothetical protein
MKWSVGGLLALGMLAMVTSTTAAAAGAGAGNFADDQQVLATLAQVVQHSNDEQIQAVATSNPSLVADTVTGEYAQQLVAALQRMHDAQVTGISLLDLKWGPISVAADGTSATVTTFETWRVTSTAGTVDDEPTRNDYTLVMDNGTWKIKADTQTVGAPTPAVTNTPIATPTVPPATPTPTATATVTPTATPTVVPTETPVPDTDTDTPPPQDVPTDAAE